MDNRRVMKAYRDRLQEKVLPYPVRGGLLTRVKRYFSGPQPRATAAQQSRSATHGADITANQSEIPPPESFSTPANNTMVDGDVTTNRILQNFFQEKGDRPLTQIEYEGVMSLLEKSRASITMPLPESPEKEEPKADDAALENRQNQTFAPYSQKVLRNVSMYDTSSSFATPDYRPVYHTFNDTSRGNISVKRVYQFSGLPSPYKTRIRAPNLGARRAKRLASVAVGNGVVAEEKLAPEQHKPLSNTANSLLSILDGENATDTKEKAARPLHNPFARNKRRTPISEPPAKRPLLGASDISKTVLHNKAEQLEDDGKSLTFGFGKLEEKNDENEKKEETQKAKTDAFKVDMSTLAALLKGYSNSANKPKEAAKDKLEGLFAKTPLPKQTGSDSKELSSDVKSAEPAEKNVISFGFAPQKEAAKKQENTSNGFSGLFGNSSLNASTPLFRQKDKTEESKPEESKQVPVFGHKEKAEEPKPVILFNFGAKAPPTASVAENGQESVFGSKSKEEPNKQGFSFGAPQQKSPVIDGNAFSFSSTAEEHPSISFGNKSDDRAAISFGSKNDEKPAISSGSKSDEKPAFSFGTRPEASATSSFSAKPNDNLFAFAPKADGKTPFSFGAKPDAKPKFSFGAKPDAKPLFSFSAKTESKPSISFGAQPENKPSISFGAKSEEKPAFTFGTKPDVNAESSSKPAFSFGTANNATSTTSKSAETPLFSFGSSKAPASGSAPGEVQSKAQPEAKFSFGTANVGVANGNGAKSQNTGDFEFPPVEVATGEVDKSKVEQFKLLFQF